MVTFKINNLDPFFVFDKSKMIGVMNDICTLLSLANGPKLNCDKNDNLSYSAEQNNYNFTYKKTSNFDGLQIEYKIKKCFYLNSKILILLLLRLF